MKLQAALVNPPAPQLRKIIRNIDCSFESKGNYLYQPLDFLQLSGNFNSEHWNLNIHDAIADSLSLDTSLNIVRGFRPNLIVLAMGDTTWRNDLDYLINLKDNHPQSMILCIGDSFAEKSAIEEIASYADGIIVSPWDTNFEILLDIHPSEWHTVKSIPGVIFPNDSNSIIWTKKPTKKSIHPPRHELFQHKKYKWPFSKHLKYTSVFTAWGCPFKCSYCLLSKSPFFYRDVDEIIDELTSIKELGIHEIYFADRSFGAPLKNVIDLLDKMIAHNYKFSWSTYFHPNMFNKDLLIKMKQSGCHTIIIGIENHDLALLNQYSRDVKVDKLKALISCAKEIGMDICADFIFGLKGQTKADILETIKFSIESKFAYASFNILAPLPGTELRQNAIKDGLIKESDRHFDSLGKGKVFSNNRLSGDEIVELRNYAVKKFYGRPSYIFNRLIRTKSFTHLLIQFLEMISLFKKSEFLIVKK